MEGQYEFVWTLHLHNKTEKHLRFTYMLFAVDVDKALSGYIACTLKDFN